MRTRYAIVRILDEKPVLIAEFAKAHLDKGRSTKARSTIRCSEVPAFKDFFEFTRLYKIRHVSEFGRKNAKKFVQWLYKRFESAHTVRHKAGVISAAFTEAVHDGVIHINPFSRIKFKRLPHVGRVLSDGEIGRFLPLLRMEVRRAFAFALYTGMRRGEIVAMRWRWIRGSYLTVPASVSKSGRSRTIILHPRALRMLGPRRKNDAQVLRLSETMINETMTAAWKRLKLGRIRFHDARHTWATRFFMATKDLRALMDQGGWAHVSSVMIYQHMVPQRRQGNLMLSYRF